MSTSLYVPAVIIVAAVIILAAGCTSIDVPPVIEVNTTENITEYLLETSFSGAGSAEYSTGLSGGAVRVFTFTQNSTEPSYLSIKSATARYEFKGSLTELSASDTVKDDKYTWSQGFNIPHDAETVFYIDTEGEWSASVLVPEMADLIPPAHFSGIGNYASPFFRIDAGDYILNVTVRDITAINFALLDYDGVISTLDTPAVQFPEKRFISFEIPVTVKKSSNYMINTASDGRWEFTLKEAPKKEQ